MNGHEGSPDDLTGRIALVTGAARSLGADIVRSLARRGAHVIVNYFHSVEAARELEAELCAAGRSCEFIRASVAKTAEVDRMFDLVRERHGGLDILVNNAAAGAFLPLLDVDDVYWERAWRTNVMGPYHCARRAAELMDGRPGAAVLCLSAVGSHLPVPGYGPGGVTKAAAESLVRYLALELAPRGIRVNTVLLGSVASDIVRSLADPDTIGDRSDDERLLRRTISTPDAADLICHFLHPHAGFVTGQTLVADGGIGLTGMQTLQLHSNLAAHAAPVRGTSPAPAGPPSGDPEPAETVAGSPSEEPRTDTDTVAADDDAVAVVGIGVALPGANDRRELWDRLREATLQASEPTGFALEHFHASDTTVPGRFHARRAGYLSGFVPDPRSLSEPHGLRDHPGVAPTARWLRHCAVQALDGVRRGAGDRWLAVTTGAHDHIGLGDRAPVLGAQYASMLRGATAADPDGDWLGEMAEHAVLAHYSGSGADPLMHQPASVSRMALGGLVPDDARHLTLDAACASGLYVLDAAVKALREGSCDVALAGGTSVAEPTLLTLFCKAQGITPSGRVRPFDRDADGTLLAEGAVALVLKTHARAVADGDEILGLVLGTGLAADGRGKGIHAPAERGQELAISRAWSDAGVGADDLDWVVAHGTGTPTGDEVEVRALLARLGQGPRTCLLSSNKQVFGHTGVLAGLVSVAHALTAIEHGAIPAQTDRIVPHALLDGEERLGVPVTEVDWRPSDRPRVVGVSSFGLGGADAHAVLADRVPTPRPARAIPEDLVVVGWNTHLPGSDRDATAAWLAGTGPGPSAGFGDPYPAPSPREVRIPPRTTAHMDPSHLMMLQAVDPLLAQLGDAAADLRPDTALLIGSALPSRHATRMAVRVHAAECADALGLLPDPDMVATLRERLAAAVDASAPDISEDDFTGAVSCIAAGRVTNYDDLQGFGVAVYDHRDSGTAALDLAMRQLRHGACELALVGAVSVAPVRGWDGHLGPLVPDGATIAEGAAVVALARRSTAEHHGLPILGTVATAGPAAVPPAPPAPGRTYLAVDALFALLHGVVTGRGTIVGASDPATPGLRFTGVRPADAPEPDIGARGTVDLVDIPVPTGATPPHPVPPGTVVVTDSTDVVAALEGCVDVAVWTTDAVAAEDAAGALAELPFVPAHVRVLTRFTDRGDAPTDALRAETLQDLLLTTTQALLPALRNGGTVGAALLDALPGDRPHPLAGLFTGFVRSVRAEITQCGGAALLTAAPDALTALHQLARASGDAGPLHTVAARGDGSWARMDVCPDGVPAGPGGTPLAPGSVVVAFGGARGITPELLHALAVRVERPHVYLIGRTPVPDGPPTEPAPQAEFIAEQRRLHPELSLRELKARYDRLDAAREVRATLRRLAEVCGPDRVHHRVCDVLDGEATTAVLDEIHDRHGRVDLVVNAVLDLRPRALHAKALADFRAVRATKATGYRNLKHALAGRPPTILATFSTLATVAPAPGDVDYCAVNSYLEYATAAANRGLPTGHREIAILWSGWKDVGVASGVAMEETLRRNNMDAYITPAQGCAQFLSSLAHPPANGLTFFLRGPERAMLARRGIGPDAPPMPPPDVPPPDVPGPEPASPLLDGITMEGRSWVVATKTWDPRTLDERDGRWMRHHRVNGAVVLPGTFALEAAAAAATRLRPDMVVTGFRDLACHASVTVRPDGPPRTVTVSARVTTEDPAGARVSVRVTTNRVSATGKVLRFGDLCYEADVLLAPVRPHLGPAPDLRAHTPVPGFRMPIYDGHPVLALSGPFAGTSAHAHGPGGTSALFSFDHAGFSAELGGTTVPSILIDALAHLLLVPRDGAEGEPPVPGPLAGIAEVDLGCAGNDCDLAARHPVVRLGNDTASGVLTAAADDRVLVRVRGVTAFSSSEPGRLVRPGADDHRPVPA
ncbi:SDR family oxidoreductase [Pseudonocardia sp. ICBG601]|uniref:SDR family oxidoreductase n=1 Tax=Pseudonocardia sp. ICBG601 TaxID=2846759 RepID=UPI001CF6F53F|nr:SDR family oxidoreductase [Pseudonocardia sp. ICBG601]